MLVTCRATWDQILGIIPVRLASDVVDLGGLPGADPEAGMAVAGAAVAHVELTPAAVLHPVGGQNGCSESAPLAGTTTLPGSAHDMLPVLDQGPTPWTPDELLLPFDAGHAHPPCRSIPTMIWLVAVVSCSPRSAHSLIVARMTSSHCCRSSIRRSLTQNIRT